MYAVWERPDIQSEGLPTSLASLLSTWSPVFFELYILHAVISDISKSGEEDAMGREPCVFDSMLMNISMKLCSTQCILHIEYTYIYIHGWRRWRPRRHSEEEIHPCGRLWKIRKMHFPKIYSRLERTFRWYELVRYLCEAQPRSPASSFLSMTAK
jgi:hypothetical protein